MLMKRPFARLIALAALLLVLWPAPAQAFNFRKDLVASASRSAAGQGSAVDVTECRLGFTLIDVTTGAATVSTFKVYLEGSSDGGSTWAGIHCARQSKRVASGPTVTFIATGGSGDGLIVNETAVVSAATTYGANCEINTDLVRVAWEIAGGGSETFSAKLVCK